MSIERDDDEESPEQDWTVHVSGRPRPARPKRIPVEQHLWRHSIESGGLAILGIIVLAALIRTFIALPVVVAAGVTLTAVIWYTALRTTVSLVMANYLGAWGVLATAFVTASWLEGKPWHTVILAPFVIAGLVLAVLGAPAIGHHREAVRREAEEHERRQDKIPLERWQRRLARHGVGNVTILHIEQNDGGEQVFGRLGKATDTDRVHTFDQLSALSEPLAVDMRLPDGSVHFSQPRVPGATAADFIINVRRAHGNRADVMLPAENKPRSINKPFAVGVMDNHRKFELTYREIAVLIIGVRGSGKTNLENIFIAQLARCIDAVVFMIDLKGGRSARPWVMPWVLGHTPRPVIDWLATTREEARIMLKALIAAGEARARSGEGWDKITPSADTPAIILVVDETGVATGHGIREDGISNTELSTLLARVTETFRSEAIDPLIAALRGNVDIMGSTAVKSQSTVRFGMRVNQSADGDSIFQDDHRAAVMLSRLRAPGDCLVMTGPDISAPVHCYRIGGEEQIGDIARWAGSIRPELEDRVQLAMGDAYGQRWKRPHGQDLLKEWRASAGLPEPPDRDEDRQFWDVLHGGGADELAKPMDPRRIEIYGILMNQAQMARDAGHDPHGYTVGKLVHLMASAGKTTPRETVSRWLTDAKGRGYTEATGPPLHRWYWIGPLDPDEIPGMDSVP